MTKANMIQELANKGMHIYGDRKMLKADVERYYTARMKEDKNMTKTTTTAPAPKTLTKKAQTLIADIQAITPAYGDRLQTLPTTELTALRRMLKDRARQLDKARKAEEAAEAKKNAEPK